MGNIQVLDQITIDKIAAGEVIERPASVVKELVENAIDAGATAIVVEIKEGGISFLRITDNGQGIQREDVRNAFLRHSTSKIRAVEDLTTITSLGFRGEALSSIAAVSQVELLTKTKEDPFGTRYVIEGGKEKELEDTAAPDGTTFLVRQLFYNTPARRKFLKTPMTEASHIGELLTRLALSHPEVSFQFINNGQSKLHTSGNGNLKDVIYHIYGREVAAQLVFISTQSEQMEISGFLGKPLISRGNRNYENYFINGRYVKSNVISKGIEDAYRDYSMQHKYPFVVLHFKMHGDNIDVNVHPTKMELRFSNQQDVYQFIFQQVREGLKEKELIKTVSVPEPKSVEQTPASIEQTKIPAPQKEIPAEKNLDYFMEKMKERVASYHSQNSQAEVTAKTQVHRPEVSMSKIKETVSYNPPPVKETPIMEPPVKEGQEKAKQLNLFEEKVISQKAVQEFRIIGQLFDTYWLLQYKDSLYIIDQHAAHERVLYERTLKSMQTRQFTSQMLSPPIILSLSMQESELLRTYMDRFERIGFQIEEFGGDEFAVRAVPDNLFCIAKKELLMEMIDQMSGDVHSNLASDLVDEKIASMSCKAAVKGNARLSLAEVQTLLFELLELDNPYHCPHGRPTIIAMTKRELEKKFKRIV